nr:MAG TPA: holin [Caudoviricetes sp.]
MRKIMVWLLALLLLLTPVWALAEETGILKQVDWTQVVVSIIGALAAAMSALLARVWTRYVRPWLEKRDMIDAAKIAVEAAEAMLGRYLGEDKWAYALNRMKDMGFNIESEVVLDALKAAWKQLDLKQLASGEKTKPPEEASAADPAEVAEG